MKDAVEQGALSLETVVQSIRIAVHESPDATFVLDRDGRILMANDALCAALQLDESHLLGVHFNVAVGSAEPERFRERFRETLAGTGSRYRSIGVSPIGVSYVAEVTQVPLRIDDQVVAVLGSALDLTNRDQQEREFHESEGLLRLAGRVARFGGWSVDRETGDVSLSDDARSLLGVSEENPDQISGAWKHYAGESQPRLAAALRACLEVGSPFDLEGVMATFDGQVLTVRTVGEATILVDGTITGAHGAIWDVSEAAASREREEALTSRLTATLNAVTDGLLFIDDRGAVVYANPRAVEMIGMPEQEGDTRPLWALLPTDVHGGFRASFDRAKSTGERDLHRAWFDSAGRWFETTAYPTHDGLAVYLRDVTDEEEARVAARQTQLQLQRQAALLDTAQDAMVVRDLNNRVQFWNRAATELYGWTADEAAGQWVGDLMYTDPGVLERATAAVLRDGFFIEEVEHRTRDGRALIIDCRWQLISDDEGHPQSIFAINTDITAYRREQDARLRAQRMEALGTLAGGIAHDLNNVLTPILMSVQLLDVDEADPARRELLETMETAVMRGADMIRQVLAFARGMEGQRVSVDVVALFDDLVKLTGDMLPSGVTTEIERATDLPLTVGDPTQLLQVLVNLVANAKDAMSGGGTLRITAKRLEISDEYTSVSHAAEAGEYVVISVEDEGHGMSADVAAKIFEPFFTTKAPGKGTGLGLATSLAIVRSHGGFMQVYSEPGRGSRFLVGLRANTAASAAPAEVAPAPPPLPSGAGELVLIVDDEATIRQVASLTLEAHGYRTAVAGNGREAIDIIERGDLDVDLVLTDMMMPVMGGAATSAYLEEHHPRIPIIAASGLSSGGLTSRRVGMGVSRFLAKPFTTSHLLSAVHETLLEHRANRDEAS